MAFRFLTPKVKQQQQKPLPAAHPFAASPLGIATNTVLGLFSPKTYAKLGKGLLHFGKEIAQGTARSIGSAGLALTEPVTHQESLGMEDIHNPVVKKAFGAVFGHEQIDSLAKRIADNELKIKNNSFAQKIGVDKHALPLAFGLILGDAGLNLTPFGLGEKGLAKQLAKEGSEEGVIKILTKARVPEELAAQYAKHFAESKTPKEAQAILDTVKGLMGTKQIAEHSAQVAEETAKAGKGEAEKLAIKLQNLKALRAANPGDEHIVNAIKNLEEQAARKAPSVASKSIVPAEQAGKAAIESTIKEGVPEALQQSAPEVGQKTLEIAEPSIKSPLGNTITPEEHNVIERVKAAIKAAAPVRGEQEKLYSAERAARFGRAEQASAGMQGEEFFKAQRRQLKGALPKVQYESIRGQLGQDDVQTLFNMVRDTPVLDQMEKLNAAEALGKLLGDAQYGGVVPQAKELQLLRQVFPEDLIKTVMKKRSLGQKVWSAVINTVNIPKAVRSSWDLSAPFRQGLFLAAKNPITFTKELAPMLKSFASEKAYQEVMSEIASRDTYKLMKEGKLALTDVAKGLTNHEEAFMSNFAEHIPGVRRSERAYVTFLNKLRADVFDKMVAGAEAAGRDVHGDHKLVEDMANFINTFSGRGELTLTGHGTGKYGGAMQFLNGVFFSPRLMLSRLHILNPAYYAKMDPFVRKEALKSLFTTAGAGLTILGLASLNKNVQVGKDPTSADFGKIKIGDTRFDIWGGSQQYIRMFAQLLSGKYTSTTSGKVIQLNDPNAYKGMTRLTILGRQLQSKEAPIVSFVTDWLRGKDYIGQEFKLSKEARDLVTPLFIQDVIDVAKNNPELLPLAPLGALGVGMQSYKATDTGTRPLQKKKSTAGRPLQKKKTSNPRPLKK